LEGALDRYIAKANENKYDVVFVKSVRYNYDISNDKVKRHRV
jgi:hypothetical protein